MRATDLKLFEVPAGRGDVPDNAGMGGHHQAHRGVTDDWLTPPWIIDALGPFDLDPCTPDTGMPWPTAVTMLNPADDGLTADWGDRFVWCNPPYGPAAAAWLEKLAAHPPGGIALIFARTETAAFQTHVFESATSIVFLAGRLHFHYPNGNRARFNAGAPSVLVAYGIEADRRCAAAVARNRIGGTYVPVNTGLAA